MCSSLEIQMVLALRYLHKEKGILHRDLAPKNIMLGENDKVTISKLFIKSLGLRKDPFGHTLFDESWKDELFCTLLNEFPTRQREAIQCMI